MRALGGPSCAGAVPWHSLVTVPCSQSDKAQGGGSTRARDKPRGAAATWKPEADVLSTPRDIPWEEGQAGTASALPGQIIKTETKAGNGHRNE